MSYTFQILLDELIENLQRGKSTIEECREKIGDLIEKFPADPMINKIREVLND